MKTDDLKLILIVGGLAALWYYRKDIGNKLNPASPENLVYSFVSQLTPAGSVGSSVYDLTQTQGSPTTGGPAVLNAGNIAQARAEAQAAWDKIVAARAKTGWF